MMTIVICRTTYAVFWFNKQHEFETYLYSEQSLMTLKGQYFEKIEWGTQALEEQLTNLIFHLSLNKIHLCVYREYAKRRKKVLKFGISRLIIEQHE